MNSYLRSSVIILLNVLLLFVVGQVNHSLAVWGFTIQIQGLFVLFQGLYLKAITGFLITVFTGLFLDSTTALSPGTHTVVLVFLWYVASWFRSRIRRENNNQIRMLSVVVQLLWFIIFSFLYNFSQFQSMSQVIRFFSDFILSMVVLLFLSPIFCRFLRDLYLSLGGKFLKE